MAHVIDPQRWAEEQRLAIHYLAAGDRVAKYPMTNAFIRSLNQLASAHAAKMRDRHPYGVAQPGLLRLALGEDRFLAEMDIRRRWIGQNCKRRFWVDDLTGNGGVIGKRYRFEDNREAARFRVRFWRR